MAAMRISLALGFALVLAAMACASAAEVAQQAGVTHRHAARGAFVPQRPPLALRNLSRRSASVYASTPCWRGCTAQCGWQFQACLRSTWADSCMAANDSCDLSCLEACRPLGGPLVHWTRYWF